MSMKHYGDFAPEWIRHRSALEIGLVCTQNCPGFVGTCNPASTLCFRGRLQAIAVAGRGGASASYKCCISLGKGSNVCEPTGFDSYRQTNEALGLQEIIRKCSVFSGIIEKCPSYLQKTWLSLKAHFVCLLPTLSQHTHSLISWSFFTPPSAKVHPSLLSKLCAKHTSFRELSGRTHQAPVTLTIFLLGFHFIF